MGWNYMGECEMNELKDNIQVRIGLRREIDMEIAQCIAQWSIHKPDDVLSVLEKNGKTREFLFILQSRLKKATAEADALRAGLFAANVRIAEVEAALLEIVELSTPERVCANCKHCEEIAGGDYCRLTGKELEDASSQECEKFEVGGFIVPGTYEIARKALEASK